MKKASIAHYVARVLGKLRRAYPGLEFEVVERGEDEVTIYFLVREEEDHWLPVIHTAAGPAVDALVEAGYKIHVQPRTKKVPA